MNRIKSVFLNLFLALIPVALSAQQPVIIDQVLAVVGGSIVLESTVESQYQQYKAQNFEFSGDPKCSVFEEQLFAKLLVNQAKLDSIEVTLQQVEAEIDNRIKTYIQRIGSKEKLEKYFGKSLEDMREEFKQIVYEQLLTQRMQMEITKDIKVTPTEVEDFFNSIPTDSLPMVESELEYQQITIVPSISEEEKKATKDKLRKLRDRIVNGEKFSTMAILYSQDPGSAKMGGELGYIGRNMLDKDFANAAFNLKMNQVSHIVESAFGYHIIQLIGRRDDEINVRHILIQPKTSVVQTMKAQQKLDSIAKLIRQDSLTFAEAARRFSDDEDTRINAGLVINPYTGNSHFLPKQIEKSTNYQLKKLKISEISDAFSTQERSGKSVYKIVKLKSKTNPHKIDLKQDYKRVQEMALADKKQKILKKWTAKKLKSTFVRIDKSYRNCKFRHTGWVK